MSISIKQQIKNNIKTLLSNIVINNKTAKVYLNDPYSIEEDQLPAICIQSNQEQIDYTTIGFPANQERVLSIEISCIYQSNLDLDNKIEEFTTLVEEVLSANEQNIKLNSNNGVVIFNRIENIEYSLFDDLGTSCGGSKLNYNVTYMTEENDLRKII